MQKPKISIIVAMDLKRGIGKNNGLLWHIPEELKHFRELTTGHPIIMGRKTYESIGKPLPNRTNIVITRDPEFKAEGIIVVNSLERALNEASQPIKSAGVRSIHPGGVHPEVFIIGGGQIYAQAMESRVVDKLYVTIVQEEFPDATAFFPEYEDIFIKKVAEKEIEAEGIANGNPETFKLRLIELRK